MDETEQLEAIDAVLLGEIGTFDRLVAHFEPSVLRVAHGISNDADRARDIAQDAFIAAYRQLPQFDSHRAKFSTWLLTITRNLAVKSNRKQKRLILSENVDVSDRMAAEPSETLQWKETFSVLDQVFAALPEAWRTAFTLTELGSLTYEQAAQVEAVPVGTIRSRVHRARKRLRSAVESKSV